MILHDQQKVIPQPPARAIKISDSGWRDIAHTCVSFAGHIFASFYFLDSFPTSWAAFRCLLDKFFGQWVVFL
jgi:hypothetical protein